MPTGENYGLARKQLMFRIIKFVEREKTGPVIPLFNTTGRLEAMLGIPRRSVFRLRSEMLSLEVKLEEDTNQDNVQLRRRTVSETLMLPKRSHRKRKYSLELSITSSPKKKGHSGKRATELTEQQQDHIR
jgi:hypothetical protein